MRPSRSSASTMSRLLPVAAASAALLIVPGCNLSESNKPVSGAGDTLMLLPENAGGPVGEINRTELLAAYGKSRYISDSMDTLRSNLANAQEAGNKELAAKIEAEGPAWQEVLHNQLAGTEPLYTVLLDVQGELREVAEVKGLSKIIEAGDDTKGIDITQDVAAALARTTE